MTIGNLAKALAAAQGAMEGAKKDRTNPHFGSAYSTLDSVWNACRGPLSANGLAVIQMPETNGNVVVVRTVLIHESGEQIESACEAVARDASPQALGACITYLRRYALAAFVGVAPEDDDANAAQPPPGQAPARQATRPAPTNGTAARASGGLKPTDPSPAGQQASLQNEIRRVYGPDVDNTEAEAHFEAMAAIERATGKSEMCALTVAEGAKLLETLKRLDAYKEPVNA